MSCSHGDSQVGSNGESYRKSHIRLTWELGNGVDNILGEELTVEMR